MTFNNKTKFLLLCIGLFNTVIGFFSLIYLDHLLNIDIFFTAIISRVMTIFLAFLNYKLFVFKTKWKFFFHELIKIYFVYLLSTVVYVILIYILYEMLFVNLYLSQILGIFVTFLIVNKAHINFTFDAKKKLL